MLPACEENMHRDFITPLLANLSRNTTDIWSNFKQQFVTHLEHVKGHLAGTARFQSQIFILLIPIDFLI